MCTSHSRITISSENKPRMGNLRLRFSEYIFVLQIFIVNGGTFHIIFTVFGNLRNFLLQQFQSPMYRNTMNISKKRYHEIQQAVCYPLSLPFRDDTSTSGDFRVISYSRFIIWSENCTERLRSMKSIANLECCR